MPQPQQPKHDITELSTEELREIVTGIQKILWWETLNANTDSPDHFWDAGKEWSPHSIEWVADILDDHGLKPEEQPCHNTQHAS